MKKVIFIIGAISLLIILYDIGTSASTSSDALQPYQEEVANDFVEQYEMAKRSGTLMDMCLRAQLVAESYLQARNEAKYAEWRGIQTMDCQAAGISY